MEFFIGPNVFMKQFVLFFSLGFLLFPSFANAQANFGNNSAAEVIRAFTACDGDFFSKLKSYKKQFTAFADIKDGEKISYIAVRNRRDEEAQSAKFSRPISVGSIRLLGYFDEATVLTPKEQYYNWGFYVADSPAKVRSRLEPLIKDAQRLKNDGTNFARLELHDGQKWVSMDSPTQFSGATPGKYVERVFLIEPSTDPAFPGTRLTCSIQGAISDIVLSDIRPDIPRSEYPVAPKSEVQTFDSVTLNPSLEDAAKKLAMDTRFRPKFSSLTVKSKLVYRDNSKLDSDMVEIYQVTQDGLIQKREIYSPNFFVDRLFVWNLVQLIAKMSNSSTPAITSEMKVVLPDELNPGTVLVSEVVMSLDQTKIIQHQVCTVRERIPANRIFKALDGEALKIDCLEAISKNTKQHYFVEDIGIFLEAGAVTNGYGETSREYSEITYKKIDSQDHEP